MIVTMTTKKYEKWFHLLMQSLMKTNPGCKVFARLIGYNDTEKAELTKKYPPLKADTYDAYVKDDMLHIARFKPLTIADALFRKDTKEPLLWIDADCVVLKPIKFLYQSNYDIILLHRDEELIQHKYNNGVFYISNTVKMHNFMTIWGRECWERRIKYPEQWERELWDQGVLARLIHNQHDIDVGELPEEYNWIRKMPAEDTIIWHLVDWKNKPGTYEIAKEQVECL